MLQTNTFFHTKEIVISNPAESVVYDTEIPPIAKKVYGVAVIGDYEQVKNCVMSLTIDGISFIDSGVNSGLEANILCPTNALPLKDVFLPFSVDSNKSKVVMRMTDKTPETTPAANTFTAYSFKVVFLCTK